MYPKYIMFQSRIPIKRPEMKDYILQDQQFIAVLFYYFFYTLIASDTKMSISEPT